MDKMAILTKDSHSNKDIYVNLNLSSQVSRHLIQYFVETLLEAGSLYYLCSWIWMVYPILPGRSSQALSDGMGSICDYFLKPLYSHCISIQFLVLWCLLTSKDQEPFAEGSAKCIAQSHSLPVWSLGSCLLMDKCICTASALLGDIFAACSFCQSIFLSSSNTKRSNTFKN